MPQTIFRDNRQQALYITSQTIAGVKMTTATSLFCVFFSLLSYKVIFWSDKQASMSLVFILAACSLCMAQIFSKDGFAGFYEQACRIQEGYDHKLPGSSVLQEGMVYLSWVADEFRSRLF